MERKPCLYMILFSLLLILTIKVFLLSDLRACYQRMEGMFNFTSSSFYLRFLYIVLPTLNLVCHSYLPFSTESLKSASRF